MRKSITLSILLLPTMFLSSIELPTWATDGLNKTCKKKSYKHLIPVGKDLCKCSKKYGFPSDEFYDCANKTYKKYRLNNNQGNESVCAVGYQFYLLRQARSKCMPAGKNREKVSVFVTTNVTEGIAKSTEKDTMKVLVDMYEEQILKIEKINKNKIRSLRVGLKLAAKTKLKKEKRSLIQENDL